MITLVVALSREVGEGFLTCSGNFSRRWLPKVLSHTVAVWCVSKRISRRYYASHRQPYTGLAAGSI